MTEETETDKDVSRGTDDFTEPERKFAESVTLAAVDIRNTLKSMRDTQVMLLALTAEVISKRESNPEVVTDRVYAFCMSWLAGALTFNRDGAWQIKSIVSFLVGAATVVVFNGFMA